MNQDLNFRFFDPEKTLEENFKSDNTNSIPILMMEHLRMLDYSISRGVSYEKTVDEFFLQLATNASLRALPMYLKEIGYELYTKSY